MRQIRIKRVYDAAGPDDGVRVLVDRLWPRGLPKAEAAVECWAKDIAPSNELRRWFGHDPKKWDEFQRRYRAELKSQDAALRELIGRCGKRPITLLYAAKDTEHNQAVVLKQVLEAM